MSPARLFDFVIDEVTPHNLADPDQLMQSVRYGYWLRDGRSYAAPVASTLDARMRAELALQELHGDAPVALMLYCLKAHYVYRQSAYRGGRGIPGFRVFHKWSLLEFAGGVPSWAQL